MRYLDQLGEQMKRWIGSELLVCAARGAERPAFSNLEYRGRSLDAEVSTLDYAELALRTAALAARMRFVAQPGDRVLLLMRPGIDFAVAFHACLRAGLIAVPCPAPRMGHDMDRLLSTLSDCTPAVIVSTSRAKDAVESAGSATMPPWLLMDQSDAVQAPALAQDWSPSEDDVAVLQYSSGSTGTPKGIQITHGNLLHQADLLADVFEVGQDSVFVTWIPHFHDMGLITSIVLPVTLGMHSVVMQPDAFVQRPARWLRALGMFGARHCTGPDFGYALCARRVQEDELAGVDLSRLQHAITGAEPVRAETLATFSQRVAATGFKRSAFRPAFGLAESTLLVTTSNAPSDRWFLRQPLDAGNAVAAQPGDADAVALISTGSPAHGMQARIVAPSSSVALDDGRVGEVWVRGASVGRGYWSVSDSPGQGFDGRIDGAGDGAWLRTGDLGFIVDGELFVRGRIKDMLLHNGISYSAPDLEASACDAHPMLEGGISVAFSVDDDHRERIIVVQELPRTVRHLSPALMEEVRAAIRARLSQDYQISVDEVLIVARSVPRTSSGKVRRSECRRRYLAGELVAVRQDPADVAEPLADVSASAALYSVWLTGFLAQRLGRPVEQVAHDIPLSSLGIDTAAKMELVAGFQKAFGCMLMAAEFMALESVEAMVHYLLQQDIDPTGGGSDGGRLTAEELLATSQQQGGATAGEERVAIVGMSCRFPSADSVEEFWSNICNGLDAVTEVPEGRWDRDALYDPNPLAVGKMSTRRGGFLRELENFDRRFFNIPAREATRMDPSHRLLLETSWEALEDAGVVPDSIDGHRVGVYIGISGSDYAQLQFSDELLADAYAGLGCALTNSASRISHFLNLRGPAIAVDTACSSSLSAMHLACQAIRNGECEMAIAGGVNIILSPSVTMSLSKAGMMAPDGKCKAFDASANGYVRSEGVAVVLLKPLSRAIADGDDIHAVIRGSSSNQDGRSSGLSAPNGEAQQRVVMAACADAGVVPSDLDYIEAHGTGTPVGDPVEINALGEVLRTGSAAGRTYLVGSVKTAIGHAESAAGMASIIKAARVVRSRQVPPNLHFNEPNPAIQFEAYGIQVPQQLQDLPVSGARALAGVNSFGVGGTNVHMVIEEPPTLGVARSAASARRPAVLLLSARSEAALKAQAAALRQAITQGLDIRDAGFTLAAGRALLDHRAAVVSLQQDDALAALDAIADGGYHADVLKSKATSQPVDAKRIAFVFSGQGTQWPGMARLLMDDAVFRGVIERCSALLEPHTGWSLLELLSSDDHAERLDSTEVAQPAIFAIQMGLSELLEGWGIRPHAVTGHSVGEIAAACVSGALTLEEACRLIAVRARLMQGSTGYGAMASVELSREEVLAELDHAPAGLCVGASNGPRTTVVSGNVAAMDIFLQSLQERGIETIRLPVNYAFHSHQLDAAREELVEALGFLRPAAPRVPFSSTVIGALLDDQQRLDAQYWGANMREEVRFQQAFQTLVGHGIDGYIEIGPNPALAATMRSMLRGTGAGCFASLTRGEDDGLAIARLLASLQISSVAVDWMSYFNGARFSRQVPRYQWDRQRYWIDGAHEDARRKVSTHPFISSRLPTAVPTWLSHLDTHRHPFLQGNRVRGQRRLGAGVLFELAAQAARELGGQGMQLLDIRLADLSVGEGDGLPLLQTTVRSSADEHVVEVHAQRDASAGRSSGWDAVLSARVGVAMASTGIASLDIAQLTARSTMMMNRAEMYRRMAEVGVDPAAAAQLGQRFHLEDDAALIELDADAMHAFWGADTSLHPVAYEMVEQAARLAAGSDAATGDLVRVARFCSGLHDAPATHAFARVRPGHPSRPGATVIIDAQLVDAAGHAVARVEGIELTVPRRGDSVGRVNPGSDWRYRYQWQSVQPNPRVAAADAGAWLLLGGSEGDAHPLAVALRERGQHVLTCAGSESLIALLDSSRTRQWTCRGVVFIASAGAAAQSEAQAIDAGLELMRITQLLSASDQVRPPRLWLVTAGACSVPGGCGQTDPAAGLLWGSARCIAIEHAEFRIGRIDADPQARQAGEVADELLADGIADQVAFRDGVRHELMLVREQPADMTVGATSLYQYARRDDGRWQAAPCTARRRRLVEHQLEIRVKGAAVRGWSNVEGSETRKHPLVAYVIGNVARMSGPMGMEPGQRVFALTSAPLSSHHVVDASVCVPWLLADDDLASAALVAPAATALFALRQLCAVSRGSRVLIRADQQLDAEAAVQVAKLLGCKVMLVVPVALHAALDHLRVEGMFDESDVLAADSIRALTAAQGVDVLLNLCAGLGGSDMGLLLRRFGRCVDVNTTRAAEVGRIHERLQGSTLYQRLDRQEWFVDAGADARSCIEEVVGLLAGRRLKAPALSTVPLDALAQHLDAPGASACTGAVLLTTDDAAQLAAIPAAYGGDVTYLITGGLGGIGLKLAQRIVREGGRHLVLLGRSAPSLTAMDALAALAAMGADCRTFSVDVADAAALDRVLQEVRAGMPPLAGIFHAAGVLENALISKMTEAQYRKAMTAKVHGAANLDRLTRHDPLQQFVAFSSLASMMGSPGQSNYAGANAYLESLMEARAAAGLPGLAIGWGPWGEVGMAAEGLNLLRLEQHGLDVILPELGLDFLEDLLLERAAGTVGALPVNWPLWTQSVRHLIPTPYFRHHLPAADAAAHAGRIDRAVLLQHPEEARVGLVCDVIVDALCLAMMLEADAVELDVPLTALGLDSIVALEVKGRIEARMDVMVRTSALIGGRSITVLAAFLVQEMLQDVDAVAFPGPVVDTSATPNLAEMSQEQIEAMLLEIENEGR